MLVCQIMCSNDITCDNVQLVDALLFVNVRSVYMAECHEHPVCICVYTSLSVFPTMDHVSFFFLSTFP